MENEKESNKNFIFVALGILALYLLPVLLSGDRLHMNVIDNMDSSFVWKVVLAHSENITGSVSSTIPQIMNGLPRDSLGSELNFELLLYRLFSPVVAYSINVALIHIMAFIGMYLLISKHVVKDNNLIICGVSLCFSLLPFWAPGELSIAGIPLALYAFLNIRNIDSSYRDWGILFLLPFYSSLEWAFFFFLTAMGIFWAYDYVHTKKINPTFLCAICFMTVVFLVVDYRLVYDMFLNPNYISHRIEFSSVGSATDFTGSISKSIDMFIHGDIYTTSLQTYLILPTILLAIILIWSNCTIKEDNKSKHKEQINHKRKNKKRDEPEDNDAKKTNLSMITLPTITVPLIICGAISLFYGFWGWSPLIPLLDKITILHTFNWVRFTWLAPTIWYIMFAFALRTIYQRINNGKLVVMGILLIQILFAFSLCDELYQPGGIGALYSNQHYTFDQYYSPGLFSEIRDYIGEPQSSYRTVNIEIDPMIIVLNGFYTLDAYQNNYPLAYKHEFRKLIAGEIDKNPDIHNYFDLWGSRCYVFVSELGLNYSLPKSMTRPITIDFNTTQFKKMGGKYVFSACEIKNSDQLGLELVHVFQRNDSPWIVGLYKVKEN